jgi:hypothetical protein
VRLNVAKAGVEGEVLSHEGVRIEPNGLIAPTSRLVFCEVEQQPTVASPLGRGGDCDVVEEHGGGLGHKDKHPYNATIL